MENKKKILIVEDEMVLRKALSKRLTAEGFSVLEAKDGEEGLETALRDHPDIILLDIIMSKMDGITMLKKLREDKWGKSANVVILTNADDTEKTADAMENDVFEYYVKSDTPLETIVSRVKLIARVRARLNP